MFPLNLQVPEKQVHGEDGSLDVIEVFSTIQGEGPFAGQPAVFVRLAGCNLQCNACDTDYTSNRRSIPVTLLFDQVERLFKNRLPKANLVVITGGEPFRQLCGPFVDLLLPAGYRVQFETNGTLRDPTMQRYLDSLPVSTFNITVVCSPKTPHINEVLGTSVTHWKYILKAGKVDPDDGLPTETMESGLRPARPGGSVHPRRIYVQPLDEKDDVENQRNTKACVESVMKYGYSLSLQTHKYLGLA